MLESVGMLVFAFFSFSIVLVKLLFLHRIGYSVHGGCACCKAIIDESLFLLTIDMC